jgi:hypothetical protein
LPEPIADTSYSAAALRVNWTDFDRSYCSAVEGLKVQYLGEKTLIQLFVVDDDTIKQFALAFNVDE